MTQSGIEPATSRFVAQHLNHCATAVPFYLSIIYVNATLNLFYDIRKIITSGIEQWTLKGSSIYNKSLHEHIIRLLSFF